MGVTNGNASGNAPAPQAMARALVREAVSMASSCLSRPDQERLTVWLLRYLEALVDDDGDAETALTEAGLAAARAVKHHGRYDAHFAPLVLEEICESAEDVGFGGGPELQGPMTRERLLARIDNFMVGNEADWREAVCAVVDNQFGLEVEP